MSNELKSLKLASDSEIVNELAERHDGVVLLVRDKSKNSPAEASKSYNRGGFFQALGMLELEASLMKAMIPDEITGDLPEDF